MPEPLAEGRVMRVGWFSLGFAAGAVLMLFALAKRLSDMGWSLRSQWNHEPRTPR